MFDIKRCYMVLNSKKYSYEECEQKSIKELGEILTEGYETIEILESKNRKEYTVQRETAAQCIKRGVAWMERIYNAKIAELKGLK